MIRQPPDQVLAALIAIGAIAAGQDEFVQQFGVHVLGLIDDADVKRALKFILERDGGDQFIARVVAHLQRHGGAADALEALARGEDGRRRVA